jgi:hypothetical protein
MKTRRFLASLRSTAVQGSLTGALSAVHVWACDEKGKSWMRPDTDSISLDAANPGT